MKRARLNFGVGCIVAALGLLGVPGTAGATLRIVATTSDIGAVMRLVGGDRVDVTVLAPGTMDPHYLEAKPSYMAAMRRADAIAYNGLQLEIGYLPLLLKGSRNRKLQPGSAGHLAMSAGIEVLEVPVGEVSRAQGDIHPEGNPHYTMDPRNWRILAAHAERALAALDPEGQAAYRANREAFVQRLDAAIERWEKRLARWRGMKVIAYHKHWEYLADWLGLEIVDYVENKPGIPPSPRHLQELEARMRAENVRVLLATTYAGRETLERLAQRTGAHLVVLPGAVGAVEGVDDPLALFERIVDGLDRAFAAAGGS